MKFNAVQTNFTAGEISPLMYGRTDINKYQNGTKLLRNFVVRPQGGICRRPGTQYINGSKLNTHTRIISFIISNSLSYVLEFGNQYIRFYTGGGIVTSSGNPVEVTTPYLSNELDQLYVAQSNDEMFIAHPNHPPQVLTRLSNTSWTLAQYVPEDGPYMDIDTTGTKVRFTQSSDSVTATMIVDPTSTITATASSSIFSSGSVGKYVYCTTGPQPFMLIATYTSGTVVSGTMLAASAYLTYNGVAVFNSGTITTITNCFTASSVGKYMVIGTALYLITGYTNATHASATAQSTVSLGVATITLSGSGTLSSSNVGQYLEYAIDGTFYLTLVLSVISPTVCKVQIIPNIVVDDGTLDINITTAAGVTLITSGFAGTFVQEDLGKYVRDANSQTWAKLNGIVNTSQGNGKLITMVPYTYPSANVVLSDDRVISGSLLFTNPTLDPSDVGKQFRLQFGTYWRSATVTAVNSPNQATCTLNDFMPIDLINPANPYAAGLADNFRHGSWTSLNGWPAIVAFYDQRLIWANTTSQPSTLWFSQPGDFYNMAPTEGDATTLATDAIYVTLVSSGADQITWIKSAQSLMVGTFGGEYMISSATGAGLSSSNVSVSGQSFYGSIAPTTAFRFGVATLFLQRGGNKLREMLYQFQYNAFNSKDISIVSEHIMRIRSGAKLMAYQVDPISIFWIVCNNGDLVSCTYERDQDLVAFAPHTIAGGTVESICVVPNTGRDDVYLVVNRTINNATVRYIEMISPFFDTDSGDTLSTMNFVDCNSNYNGTPATTISGLSYLQGQTVYAVADGKVVGPFTVSGGGTITLSVAASNVTVGLIYSSTVGTLNPDGGSQTGTSQGKRKRVSELSVRVKDSLPFQHGQDLTKLTMIDAQNFVADLNDLGTAGTLVSGDTRFSVDMAWDVGAEYYITQSQPVPLTIVSLMPIIQTNE